MKKAWLLFFIVVMFVLIYCILKQIEQSAIEQKASTVILGDTDRNINITIDSQIQYSHSVHSSVGYNYEIEYDKQPFY